MNYETILNYINSKDIRNHLRHIGYTKETLGFAGLAYNDALDVT